MTAIVVVGVGALGSHVVQFLRNIDTEIRVVDFDRIEQKNVQAQFHTKNSVGKNKAQSLTQLMQFMYGRKIIPIPHKLTKNNTDQILSNANLILDCLDNAEARNIVQNYVRKNNLACLHGALSADGMFGRVVWDNIFTIDSESVVGAPTCEGGEHLPFIGLVASQMAQSVKKFLDNGRQTSYNISPISTFAIG